MKVKGWKTRLNKRAELKFTTYIFVANPDGIAAGAAYVNNMGNFNSARLIWSNQNIDRGGTLTYMTWPQQGNGGNQIEGTKFNLLYAEVCFTLYQQVIPAVNSGIYTEHLRLFVIRQRDASLLPTVNTIFTHGGAVANGPINSKNWDIQFDKTWTKLSGTDTSGQPLVLNPVGNTFPKEMNFRFIIPLKHTFNVQPTNQTSAFPLHVLIGALTYYNNNMWAYRNLNVTYYYRDP